MANRFTDSRKWDDPWFRKLPCKYKAFFIFLIDKCNHAGIWKVDFESAEFHIGEKLDKQEIFKVMEGRIVEIKDKWFIPKFIDFQYQTDIKGLNPDNRVHQSVLALLTKEGLIKGLKRGLQGGKDKDYDKDKDKVKYLDFVLLTKEEHQKLLAEFGEAETKERIARLNEYGHQKPKKFKEYGSHYHTILAWARKDKPEAGSNLTKAQKSNLNGLKKTMERISNDKSKLSTGLPCFDSGVPRTAI
jgi:hypothetical protein